MTILPHLALTSLRDAVRGEVLLPGDPGFDQAHRPWNLAIPQSVLAVVEAADAADVAALVRFAAARGLSVATQPSGHGATGRADGAILLRTFPAPGRRPAGDVDAAAASAEAGARPARDRARECRDRGVIREPPTKTLRRWMISRRRPT